MNFIYPIKSIDVTEPSNYELVSTSADGILFKCLKWGEFKFIKYSIWWQMFIRLGAIKIIPVRLLDIDEDLAFHFAKEKRSTDELRLLLESNFEQLMISDYLSGTKYLHDIVYRWSKEYGDEDDLGWYMPPWVTVIIPFWHKVKTNSLKVSK